MRFVSRLCLVLLAILVVRCGNHSRDEKRPEMPGRVFLSNSAELRDGLLKTIADDSGILLGGYILIIPVGIDPEDQRVRYLEKKISFTLPNATHTLSVRQEGKLRPSERITVEGASLIFLVGGAHNRFMKLAGQSGLGTAIKQAHHDGAAIVGLNQSACLLGERTILRRQAVPGEDDRPAEDKYRLIEGLQLVPGFITDLLLEDEINEDAGSVRNLVDTLDFHYMGILPEGIVMIDNTGIRNLGKSDVVMKRSGPAGEWNVLKRSKAIPLN